MIERYSPQIVLVGTAHVSKRSVEEVRAAIQEFEPDIVGVELDKTRYESLRDRTKWRNTPITDIIRSGRAYFFMAQLFLWTFQRQLAQRFGVEPGAEMIEAINGANAKGLKLALLDRDIGITLKRAWRLMALREKLRFVWALWEVLFGLTRRPEGDDEGPKDEEELARLMDEDVLSEMMEEIGRFAPSVKRVLIDERDQYLAKKILLASEQGRVVAVVGAGHMKGVRAWLERGFQKTAPFEELCEVPEKKIPWGTIFGWSIPFLFFWIVLYQGLQGGLERAGEAFFWWWAIHGVLAGLGCAVARGHPLSIASAVIVAGFTAIHPAVAAGWISGLVEAKVRTPTVADFERLQEWKTLADFFRNPVTRVLFVVALTNLGSSAATYIALPILVRGLA